jgi:predicted nucleic acid-binding protein
MPPYDFAGLSEKLAGFSEAFDLSLRHIHLDKASEPLELPEPHGAFPGSLLPSVPPVVVDANILRGDILYACRKNTRTTLTNAANAGAIRLFGAQHVVDEVARLSGEWTKGTNVTRTEFLVRWATQYLPLIRIVRKDDLRDDLLDPDEQERIARLQVDDPDDVPSATLALGLGAFYLTKDEAAWRAVYGREADPGEHEQWVEILKAGGDAGELGMLLNVAGNLSTIAAGSIAQGARWLTRTGGGWVWVPVGLAVAAMWFRAKPATRQKLRDGSITTAMTVAQAFSDYQNRLERFRAAAPSTPSWESLIATTDKRAVLARACLRVLARSSRSDRSAEELANRLPELGVGQSEALVRGILRSHGCFVEIWSGRWQVGRMHHGIRPYIEHMRIERDEGSTDSA